MTAKVFLKPLKAKIRTTGKTLASLAAVRRNSVLSKSEHGMLSHPCPYLNAMTSVSAMIMPERETGSAAQGMHSLWEGSLQNGASKRFSFYRQ
jgi:hypothetical protein